MFDKMIIKSKLKDYSLEFVNDAFQIMELESKNRSFFIIDSLVYDLYIEKIKPILADVPYIIIQAVEQHKSYDYCGNVIKELINKKIRRNNKVIAIGGGIVQDISAFISSILFRGLEWSFIPTTLLAQADSCIGGKTSINFGEVKNTIGNFNPPKNVFIDTMFLNTLPVDDIKSGIGEMLHFYFYSDSKLTESIFNNYNDLLINRDRLRKFMTESLRIKKSVIEIDEFDNGERNKFNYGHTFGHALESITNYGIKHGQAVTIGMDIANLLSCNIGLMKKETYYNISSKLKLNFPDYNLRQINVEDYINYLSMDKKNINEQLVCILSEGPGKLVKKMIPMDSDFKLLLTSYFEQN